MDGIVQRAKKKRKGWHGEFGRGVHKSKRASHERKDARHQEKERIPEHTLKPVGK